MLNWKLCLYGYVLCFAGTLAVAVIFPTGFLTGNDTLFFRGFLFMHIWKLKSRINPSKNAVAV